MLDSRTASLCLIAAFAMTGCLTTQTQSPIYDHQSTDSYPAAPASSTNASYQTAGTYRATPATFQSVTCPAGTEPQSNGTCLLQESVSQSQGSLTQSGARDYDAARASAFAQYSAGAPTTQNVASPTSSTPGQNMVRATAVTAPEYSRVITRAPGAPTYQGASTYQPGSSYQVSSGDTVYSLARRLCVPVSEIQSANGLGADFGIKIGQSLTLPPARC